MARAGEEFLTSFLNTIGSGIKERRAKTEAYKEEGYDAELYFYRWMPIFWFFILIYNVFFRDRNDNTGLE